MTRGNHQNKTKFTLIFNLFIILILCFSMLFVSACKKEEATEDKKPTYSYTETDDGVIKNASFSYGTVGASNTSFPKTSLTGWTLTKSSSAKSGVVSTKADAWTELMSTLYSDSGILNYLKEVEEFDNDKVKEAIKTEKGSDATSDEIKEYILKNYYNKENSYFSNPGTHPVSEGEIIDDRIYMLNNYSNGWIGAGSTQKLTSSTEITLNKGEFAEVSVWVKTANITCPIDANAGANIRITNSFNGSTQKDFGIFNIKNTDWKQYTFYVQADDVYETKFTLVLGLGYDGVDVEGTVYFDDITIKHIEKLPEGVGASHKINYNDKDAEFISANDKDVYDMSIDVTAIKDATFVPKYTGKFTTASNGENGGKFNDVDKNNLKSLDLAGVPYDINKGIKIELDRQSYTVTLSDNGNNFSVLPENYASINFFVKNKLSKFSSTTITVDVWDIADDKGTATLADDVKEKRAAVATLSEVNDEWQKISILVKNNFDKDVPAYSVHKFYLDLVIGTPDVKSNNVSDYASGTVYITNPFIATGYTCQYLDKEETIETDNYKYYQLLSGSANGSTSLYAGYSSDYVADETNSESYSLTVAPSEMGVIFDRPAQPKNYKGIGSKHFYINPEEEIYAINTNANAGLINSKYVNKYAGKTESDFTTDKDKEDFKNWENTWGKISKALIYDNSITNSEIQPLMIYNDTDSNYGYIGNTNTIAASAYAKVSVKVRAVDSAVAYIYLVDTSNTVKSVMNFDEFKENLDFSLKVTSDMMEDDGWTTVEFYVAAGATEKSFRVEVWNGSRDGSDAGKSDGYVFFNDISVTTSSAFTEPEKVGKLASSPLNGKEFKDEDVLTFKRELTDLEKKFNTEVVKGKVDAEEVKYVENYVWAKNDKIIYAVFNTIDPVEVDPYEAIKTDEEETEEEEKEFDASTFWLSLSSILLGVALALALIMLVVKNIRRRRKANASDAKSHYTVTSRTRKKPVSKIKSEDNEDVEESTPEIIEEDAENEEDVDDKEQTLDEYVYDDVQVFGEEDKNSEEETSSESSESESETQE